MDEINIKRNDNVTYIIELPENVAMSLAFFLTDHANILALKRLGIQLGEKIHEDNFPEFEERLKKIIDS